MVLKRERRPGDPDRRPLVAAFEVITVRPLGDTSRPLAPYLQPGQITSGTLAYAAGAGKAVISTPYTYARELLADGRGILVPWRDSGAIAEEVSGLLRDPGRRKQMCTLAAEYGREPLLRFQVWQIAVAALVLLALVAHVATVAKLIGLVAAGAAFAVSVVRAGRLSGAANVTLWVYQFGHRG